MIFFSSSLCLVFFTFFYRPKIAPHFIVYYKHQKMFYMIYRFSTLPTKFLVILILYFLFSSIFGYFRRYVEETKHMKISWGQKNKNLIWSKFTFFFWGQNVQYFVIGSKLNFSQKANFFGLFKVRNWNAFFNVKAGTWNKCFIFGFLSCDYLDFCVLLARERERNHF